MNCDGAPMPRVGDHAYDILQITGMSLFFGDRTVDGSDGTTPTSRPSALDTTTPFERSALAN